MVNTSRRDRPPSGRVNLPRPSTAHPNSNYNGNNNSGRPPTGRPMSAVPTIPQLVPSSGSRNKERAGSAGGGDRFPKHNVSYRMQQEIGSVITVVYYISRIGFHG